MKTLANYARSPERALFKAQFYGFQRIEKAARAVFNKFQKPLVPYLKIIKSKADNFSQIFICFQRLSDIR
jgi:hypothetical protein